MTTICNLTIFGACCMLLFGCTCEQDSCHGLVPGGTYRITLHESAPNGREYKYPACQANFDLFPGSQLTVGVNGSYQPRDQPGCCQVATNADLPLSQLGPLSFEGVVRDGATFRRGGDLDVFTASKNVVTETGCRGVWGIAVEAPGAVKLVDKPYDPNVRVATLYRSFWVDSASDPQKCAAYSPVECADAWGVDIQTVSPP